MSDRTDAWAVFGPALTAGSVCDLLNVDAVTLRYLVETDQLLELMSADDVPVYLRAQLGDDGAVLRGLPDVIAELATGVDDPWVWAAWLAARTDRRGGRNAFEQLREGEVEEVVRDACRAAWAWRV